MRGVSGLGGLSSSNYGLAGLGNNDRLLGSRGHGSRVLCSWRGHSSGSGDWLLSGGGSSGSGSRVDLLELGCTLGVTVGLGVLSIGKVVLSGSQTALVVVDLLGDVLELETLLLQRADRLVVLGGDLVKLVLELMLLLDSLGMCLGRLGLLLDELTFLSLSKYSAGVSGWYTK